MLDRLLYRDEWFDLPNQRPLEECYWQTRREKKPVVGYGGRRLRSDDYACDWKIEGRKLWLLSVTLEEDGSELLPRIAPGIEIPLVATWHTGILDANGRPLRKQSKHLFEEVIEVPLVRFRIENGSVVKTDHFKVSPQHGWLQDEPSLRQRKDWKSAPG